MLEVSGDFAAEEAAICCTVFSFLHTLSLRQTLLLRQLRTVGGKPSFKIEVNVPLITVQQYKRIRVILYIQVVVKMYHAH